MTTERVRDFSTLLGTGMRERMAPTDSNACDLRGGAQSPKAARTLKRFVAAAKEVFEERGFLDTRISDIADRASQSHGSFYYYFNSKEQAFRAVVTELDEQLYAPLEDFLTLGSQIPLEQRIRGALRRHFEGCTREARILALVERVASYEPSLRAMRVTRHRRYTERVANSIRHLQTQELADTHLEPVLAAAALGALTSRFTEMWLVHGAIECTLDQAVEQVAQIFANMLGLKIQGTRDGNQRAE